MSPNVPILSNFMDQFVFITSICIIESLNEGFPMCIKWMTYLKSIRACNEKTIKTRPKMNFLPLEHILYSSQYFFINFKGDTDIERKKNS